MIFEGAGGEQPVRPPPISFSFYTPSKFFVGTQNFKGEFIPDFSLIDSRILLIYEGEFGSWLPLENSPEF